MTLTGVKHPRACQCCEATHSIENPLSRWLEHDENDRPCNPSVVVVLCKRCSDALIDLHPRLYRQLALGEPFPGCMGVCVKCVHRAGVACTSTAMTSRGGPGLKVKWVKPPNWMHLNFGGGRGETRYEYHGPVISCSGREVRA